MVVSKTSWHFWGVGYDGKVCALGLSGSREGLQWSHDSWHFNRTFLLRTGPSIGNVYVKREGTVRREGNEIHVALCTKWERLASSRMHKHQTPVVASPGTWRATPMYDLQFIALKLGLK